MPRTRAVPVVVMTSSREQRDMVEGYRLGVNSYIQKPIDFDQFQNHHPRPRLLLAGGQPKPPARGVPGEVKIRVTWVTWVTWIHGYIGPGKQHLV